MAPEQSLPVDIVDRDYSAPENPNTITPAVRSAMA
jgi:hypothetical protein